MTKERKLYLVKAKAPGADEPPEPPPTLEEERAAAALREAIERGNEPISSSLRAAWSPDPLSSPDHDALLARGLGDLEAPPTEAELRAAAMLSEALEEPGKSDPLAPSDADLDAAFLRSLRSAVDPAPLGERAHEVLLDRLLADPLAPPTKEELAEAEILRASLEEGGRAPSIVNALRAAERPRVLDPQRNEKLIAAALGRAGARRRNIVSIMVGALALAAGIALFATQALKGAAPGETSVARILIPARSTADLFDAAEPFPRSGGESGRIDRILSARSADLRTNQFAAWGVK